MKKLLALLLAITMNLVLFGTVSAADTQAVLESDAQAVMPTSFSIDEDFVFVSTAPGGSSVKWTVKKENSTVDYTSSFIKNEKYMPEIGEGAFNLNITATLTYSGNTKTATGKYLAFRTKDYRLNSLIYEREDGTTILHPEENTTIIAADVDKNPRVTGSATLVVASYSEGKMTGVSMAKIDKSGLIPMNCPVDDFNDSAIKVFMLKTPDKIVPLRVPEIKDPVYESDKSFFKEVTVTNSDGKIIKELTDNNTETIYTFDKQILENTNGMSLHLSRPEGGSAQSAFYPLDNLTGKTTFTYDFMVTTTNEEHGLMYLYNKDNECALSLIIQGNTVKDNGSNILSDTLAPFEWHRVSATVDIDSQSADIYYDGALKFQGYPLRTTSSELAQLRIHNSAGTGASGMYIDNISIENNDASIYTDDFSASELADKWEIARGGGTIEIKEFKDTALTLYPQEIMVDIGREAYVSGVTVTIPENNKLLYRVEKSTRIDSGYAKIASHLDNYITGTVADEFDGARCRYIKIWIYRAVDSEGNFTNASIAEIDLKVKDDTSKNVAPLAHISASTNTEHYDVRGVIDGIVAADNRHGEWLCFREGNPKVFLSWDNPQVVTAIEIAGRKTDISYQTEYSEGVEITFDDGTTMRVLDIPASGEPKRVMLDSPKDVNYMIVRVIGCGGGNIGLSEIRVLTGEEGNEKTEYLSPWKTITAPKDYSGQWIVSDDLNNDGKVEFVSARATYMSGVENHYVSALCAFDLEGNEIWHWGEKTGSRTTAGSDVPCQIYDIDNDGKKEVIICTRTELIVLNGQTGAEKSKFTLPKCDNHPTLTANDSIAFANISGNTYASDILVKTRYSDVWAFTKDGQMLWHTCRPGNMKVGHYPRPIDIDNDGKDEVIAGFAMIDDNGSIMWSLDDSLFSANLSYGHVDSVEILNFEKGMARKDMRFAVAPCGGMYFFIIDGNGRKLWESEEKLHYETLLVGKFTENGSDKQIITNPVLSDTDKIGGDGYNPVMVYDYDGNMTLTHNKTVWGYTTNRYIPIVNMGYDTDFFYQPSDNALFDGDGRVRVKLLADKRYGTSAMRWDKFNGYHNDMDGDGTQDITGVVVSGETVSIIIYQNINGPETATKLGTGYNHTYY